ncbi:hypothetical protein GCM10022267_75690 [Lentzea roselyniae]|uniref:Uncharacterized protein n=1 Tax=Lentzea roselyniae TaxID=531940 RepID=A0ABP7C5U3_9PSEU
MAPPSIPATGDFSGASYEQILFAVTGQGTDLDAILKSAESGGSGWYRFASKANEGNSIWYRAWDKYYFGADFGHDTFTQWASGVAEMETLVNTVASGRSGLMDVQRMWDGEHLVVNYTHWLNGTNDIVQRWATSLESDDSAFKGKAAYAIGQNLRRLSFRLNDLHSQIMEDRSPNTVEALKNTASSLSRFAQQMTNAWFEHADTLRNAAAQANNAIIANIFDFIAEAGLSKGRGNYQLDLVGNDESTRDNFIRTALSRYSSVTYPGQTALPEGFPTLVGDLTGGGFWSSLNSSLSNYMRAEMLKLAVKARPEIAALNESYTVNGRSLGDLKTNQPPTVGSPTPDGGKGGGSDLPPPPGGGSGGGTNLPPPPGGGTGGANLPPPSGGGTGGANNLKLPGGSGGTGGGALPPPPGGGTSGLKLPPPGSSGSGGAGGDGLKLPPPPGAGSLGSGGGGGNGLKPPRPPGRGGLDDDPFRSGTGGTGGTGFVPPPGLWLPPPPGGGKGNGGTSRDRTGTGALDDWQTKLPDGAGGPGGSLGSGPGGTGWNPDFKDNLTLPPPPGAGGLDNLTGSGGTGGTLPPELQNGGMGFGPGPDLSKLPPGVTADQLPTGGAGLLGSGGVGGSGLGGADLPGTTGHLGSGTSDLGSSSGLDGSGTGSTGGWNGNGSGGNSGTTANLSAGGSRGDNKTSMPFMPPMGGMGAPTGNNNQQQERERQTWLSEDEEVWGTNSGAGVGVIGLLDSDEVSDDEPVVQNHVHLRSAAPRGAAAERTASQGTEASSST